MRPMLQRTKTDKTFSTFSYLRHAMRLLAPLFCGGFAWAFCGTTLFHGKNITPPSSLQRLHMCHCCNFSHHPPVARLQRLNKIH